MIKKKHNRANIPFRLAIGILLLALLAGCKPSTRLPASPTLAPASKTVSPTLPPASTNTPSPAVTATAPSLTVSSPSRIISPQNAAEVSPLSRLGYGMINGAPFYSTDGKILVVPTTIGVDLYKAATLQRLSFIASLFDKDVTLMPAYPRLVTLSSDSQLLAANLNSFVFSANGKIDESSIGEMAVFLWKVSDGTLVRKIPLSSENNITDLAFTPDNKTLAIGFDSDQVQLWSVADGKELAIAKGSRLEFSPDGSLFATMPSDNGKDHQVYVYNLTTGVRLRKWEGTRATFSLDGLLAVENQGAVRLMDIKKGAALHAFNGESAAFSSDGQRLALLDRGRIKLYQVKDGRLLQTLESDFEAVNSLKFAPDGQSLAIVGEAPMCPNCLTTPSAAIWKISDGSRTALEIQDPLRITFAPHEGYLVLWSVDAIRFLNPENAATVAVFAEFATSVDGIAFSPNGQILAANSGQPHLTTHLWQIEDNGLVQTLEDPRNPGYGTAKVSYDPNGQILYAQGSFWNTTDGKPLTSLTDELAKEAPPYIPASVAFSPDGSTLAIGYLEGNLQLWDLKEKKLIRRLEGYSGEVVSLSFSADGKTLAAVFAYPDFTIQLWKIPEGDRLISIKGVEWTYEFTQAVFSPDGEILASVAKNEDGMDKGIVELWRASDGQRLLQLEAVGIMDVAFSPDGKMIATGSYDHTVRLWQATDGKLLKTLRGHGDSITDLTFSPSGELLASGSNDGTVIIWGVPGKP